jgi:hypothetical protein
MKRFSTVFFAPLFVCIFSLGATAQQTAVRVEEDWQLHVMQPDEQLDAPQVTTTMIPFSSCDNLLLQVDLNHATAPSFSNGGLQVRACIETNCLAQVRLFSDVRLKHESEVINWTQFVQQEQGGFQFGISRGSSETWGDFGGEPTFVSVSHSDSNGSLSLAGYDPQRSIDNSAATYASNRVGYLRLVKVRVYSSNGSVAEWTLNQDVR